MTTWIISVLLVVPAFFLWAFIHEYSHYIAAKLSVHVYSASFKIYPHVRDGRFHWASMRFTYVPADLTVNEHIFIKLAPRIPGLLACLILPFVPFPWAVLVGAGVVDLLQGSMGMGENSDLRTASRLLQLSPWVLRSGGWAAGLLSFLMWFVNWLM